MDRIFDIEDGRVNRKRIYDMDSKQKDAIIEALCGRYNALFVIGAESDTLTVMYMPARYDSMAEPDKGYEDGLKTYCDTFVCDVDRIRVEKYMSLAGLKRTLDNNTTAEISYKTVDDRYMSARAVEIRNPDVKERTFLLGIVKYEHELEEEQRLGRSNDIITSLAESYQVIYRVNIVTCSYEIILMNFDRTRFVDNFANFEDLEKNYIRNGVELKYIKAGGKEPSISNIREHLKTSREPMEAYYREWDGRWLKLVVTPDKNYSDERPYVIYAIKECNEQIERDTASIINSTAVSKIYILNIIIDEENDSYNCLYSDDHTLLPCGTGRFSDFIRLMKKLVYEEDYYIFESLLDEAVPGRKGFVEREYRAEDGRGMVHYLNGFSTYVNLPEGGRKLLLVRNIDERAANRARISLLDDQTTMLRNILYALGDAYFGIYYCDLVEGTISPAREDGAVHDLLVTDNYYETVMRRYISEYVLDEDKERVMRFIDINNIRRSLREEGQSMHCEFMRRFDNGYRWVRVDVQAIHFKGGYVKQIIMAYKDIHDERSAELRHKKELKDALAKAENASKAKSEFLSNISHDLRTPMNAVMGMTDIALNHIGDMGRVKACLTRIDTAAKYLLSLINDVLDMSYIESGKMTVNEETFSLPQLVHGIIAILQQQAGDKKLNFSAVAIGVTHEELVGDRLKLDQILTNVIGNAIKYTQSGGRVKLTIEQQEISAGTANYIFKVEDNGCGMSKEFCKRIFQPFEREYNKTIAMTEGTGLGMSITGKYVQMLGGRIDIDSEKNVGSKFTISIPFKYIDKALDVDIDKSMEHFEIIHFNNVNDDLISRIKSTSMCNGGRPVVVAGTYDESYFDEDLYKAGMKAYVTEPVFLSDIKKIEQKIIEPGSDEDTGNDNVQYDFTGRRILVVDDNDINADIAVDYLEDVNAQCDTASNGKEAYDLIAGGTVYDLILMDVRMPVMNGYDATRAIRNLKTDYALNVPIVAMTANAFKEDIDATYKCGMNGHITKPMSSDALYSILYRLLS